MIVGGLLTVGALLLSACSSGGPGSTSSTSLPSSAQSVIDQPQYAFAQWNWDAVDMASGKTIYAQNANTINFLGSTTKLFTVGSYLDTMGVDSTLETPVYVNGTRSGDSLRGDLVLVGAGDFILGGRGVLSGDLQWEFPDHFYAYASPTAKPVAADPLAGLDKLAAQVKASGISSVTGDVLVDDRLWKPYESKEGVVAPIMVNDNLLDMLMQPGAKVGDPATVDVRPKTQYFEVINQAVTTAAGTDATATATLGADNRIVISGNLPIDSKVYNLITFAPDAAAYARALFIEALRRAGVTVETSLTTATGSLPAADSYSAPAKVASLTSPPASILTKLVSKTSDNRGAESLMCLLAVKAGSNECETGLSTILASTVKAGVDSRAVFPYDGEGSDPSSAAPSAIVQWLTWAHGQSWGTVYRDGLPELGDSNSIVAKSGVSARPPMGSMPALAVVVGQAGYMTTASGKDVAFAVYAANGSYPDTDGILFTGLPDTEHFVESMQKSG
jgi:D-alanyl-D-alanine carboxypeptidase/D-alanyl-D-alanine-endopeptidase (penicillin-binding protein 4)